MVFKCLLLGRVVNLNTSTVSLVVQHLDYGTHIDWAGYWNGLKVTVRRVMEWIPSDPIDNLYWLMLATKGTVLKVDRYYFWE